MQLRVCVSLVFALSAGTSALLTGQQTPARPLPYPLDVPVSFMRAVEEGTRSETGVPGPAYWQQWTDYTIRARLEPTTKRVEGTVRIVYHNHAPRPLPAIALQLVQNVHAEGAVRNRHAEVTGGMEITRLLVAGQEYAASHGWQRRRGRREYIVSGTTMQLVLPERLAPGDSVTLEIDFAYLVPQRGAGERMGWSRDNLFYLAYWYPQMAVYDDVVGWQTDDFLGTAEFYMGYGSYDVTLEVPAGWVVSGTGTLANEQDVFPEHIRDRIRRAESSDTVVHIITPADFGAGRATQTSPTGVLAWHFTADSVRDVAYGITRESRWDAARTPVGDRDGDGETEYALTSTVWREAAFRWQHAWRYAQHSIDFLSRWTGYPYPWPHMTAVEGEELMRGGMEYPMMTLIGGYTENGDTALYGVTAHELAHMWVPMIVGNDERRAAWMDEGTTSFNTGAAENEFYPGQRWEFNSIDRYLRFARTRQEGPIMTPSDFHTTSSAYQIASYSKPASMLWTLRGLLGEETFLAAYRAFIARWAFKHPTPWDFFNTFEDVSGRDLGWFWRSWYDETWTLDQSVGAVESVGDGTRITVNDLGTVPMPARLTVTTADGQVREVEIPVERWLAGARSASVVIDSDSPVTRVEIDAAAHFPDANRRNNRWDRT